MLYQLNEMTMSLLLIFCYEVHIFHIHLMFKQQVQMCLGNSRHSFIGNNQHL